MMFLVTGATGNVGRLVAARLLARGHTVRALTRDPSAGNTARLPAGVEIVRGDLARPDTLADALAGVERMYLFPVPETVRDVIALARDAGVRRIVTLSSGAVADGSDDFFHHPVEQAVEACGLEWTHVRPGEFMLNKLWLWGPSIRAGRVVHEPFPDAAWCPVHEADIADVAAAALLDDGHTGAAYTLNGPELISTREQIHAIEQALGEHIRIEKVTRERARELYLAQGGFAAANADFLLGFQNYDGTPAEPVAEPEAGPQAEPEALESAKTADLPTAEHVTGRPARTFAQWARDHADDFRHTEPSP